MDHKSTDTMLLEAVVKLEKLRGALTALVDNIDSGVSAEAFKASERQNPKHSSLRCARDVLKLTQ